MILACGNGKGPEIGLELAKRLWSQEDRTGAASEVAARRPGVVYKLEIGYRELATPTTSPESEADGFSI